MCLGYDYKETNKKQNENRKMDLSQAKKSKEQKSPKEIKVLEEDLVEQT